MAQTQSPCYNFLLYRFEMGKITGEELKAYVPKRITAEEYYSITGIVYSE